MNKYISISLAFILFSICGCMDDDVKEHREILVKLNFQEEFSDVEINDVPVLLTNRISGRKFYSSTTNEDIATFSVEDGIYNISSSFSLNPDTVFNGSVEDIIVADITDGELINMDMISGRLSPIIFKEIYYTGSRTPENKSYFADQFHELYNNSTQVQYLDGLCLGLLQPSSSSKTKWVTEDGKIMPLLPINFMVWRFPGNGIDYPIQPGESIIVAQDGINHRDDPSGNPNSPIDLSMADWETYFELSGKDTDNPAVPNMQMIWANNTTMVDWLHSVSGAAVILFKIPGSWEEFVTNPDNLMTTPGSTSQKQYLMIPEGYVWDAVECVKSETKSYKRLPNKLDAGYIYCSGMYVKESIRRKVKEIKNGVVIYKDTNNSGKDFIVNTPPTPWEHPASVD